MMGISFVKTLFMKKKNSHGTPAKRKGMPSLANNDQFSIQATTYEINAAQNDVMKKYTGYSKESEIIPATVSYCNQNKHDDNYCTRPIVSTTTHVHSNECIIVEDKIKFRKNIHWL
jgi:hypothetical protein